jgi:hypothetical protein
MITTRNLPNSYIPYNTLVVCSNTLTGGVHLVKVDDILPVVVGKGDKPKIWLQALTDSKTKIFMMVVEASISSHPAVKVYEDFDTLKITISGTLVLSVKATGDDSAEIDTLDMRPLGLNLYGTKNELMVGGNTFSGNSMSGGGTFIGFSI